ncbi:MAG: SPOR domain-containing protein, partial [Methylocystis sp.]|nr:SPOR domain-containing protein [Methylocystis sp.]
YSQDDSVGRYRGFAAIVMDANSGRELWGHAVHELRHPASVTKVMTLYLLFEQLEQGRLRLNSPLMISEHAASQAPSKLGLNPGDSITVENAIKAVVTKSANDVAVAIAENIGGDEETFARMMTRKAHALGMRDTHYENASGLPNSNQVTTAYDLALLGRAIQDRFPRYYRYFSTHSFAYNGGVHRNHNHLLGRVEGMDGIKTGYTRASGFNLLTNVRRDGHHIVAVVLGGKTAGQRDRIMANLIEDHIGDGATVRTARAITEDGGDDNTQVASADDEDFRRQEAAERRVAAQRAEREAQRERAARFAEQQQRLAFAEVDDEQTASVGEEDAHEARRPAPTPLVRVAGAEAPLPPAPIQRPDKAGKTDKARPAFVSGIQKFLDAGDKKAKPDKKVADGSTSKSTTAQVAISGATPSAVRSSTKVELVRPKNAGWMIQIGAAEDADKANQLLSRARSQLRGMPATAQAFTEKVQKGNTTLYRARFAGLEERSAKSACDALKSSGFACFPTKN